MLLQEYPELAADHQVRLIYFQVRLIQFWPSVVYFAFPQAFLLLLSVITKDLQEKRKDIKVWQDCSRETKSNTN